jgi:hypothetical protein
MQFVKANYGRVIAAGLIDGALYIVFLFAFFSMSTCPLLLKHTQIGRCFSGLSYIVL